MKNIFAYAWVIKLLLCPWPFLLHGAQIPSAKDSLYTLLEFGHLTPSQEIETHLSIIQILCEKPAKTDAATVLFHGSKATKLADSLERPILKVEVMHSVASYYRQTGNYTILDSLAQEIMQLSEKNDYHLGRGMGHYWRGALDSRNGNSKSALDHYSRAKHYFEQTQSMKWAGIAATSLGAVVGQMGDLPQAYEYFLEALDYKRKANVKDVILELRNIATILWQTSGGKEANEEERDRVLGYLTEASMVAKEMNDPSAMAYCNIDLASYYMGLDQYQKALDIGLENIALIRQSGKVLDLININEIIGQSYIGLSQYDQAMDHIQTSLQLAKEAGMQKQILNNLNALAKHSLATQDFLSARKYALEGYEMALAMDVQVVSKSLSEMLFQIEEKLGNYPKALYYHQQFKAHADSLVNASTLSKIADIEAQNLLRQKTDSIRYASEREKWMINQTLEAEKEIKALSIIIAVILGALLVVLYLFFYRKKISYRDLLIKNQSIEREKTALQSQENLKSRYFADISHELRTPLTLVSGPLSLIKHKLASHSDPQIDKNIALLSRSTDQMIQLVDTILNLAKTQVNDHELTLKDTHLHSYINDIWEGFIPLFEKKGIRHQLNISGSSDLVLKLDAQKLSHIITNLLSNAAKFTQKAGEVSMSISMEDAELHLSVRDTGTGISEAHLPHIFDRFYQGDQTDRDSSYAGVGIGLALCKEYARVMQGDIHVESVHGEGSTFSLVFAVESVSLSAISA